MHNMTEQTIDIQKTKEETTETNSKVGCGAENLRESPSPPSSMISSDLPPGTTSASGSAEANRKPRTPTRSEPATPGHPAPPKPIHHASYCPPTYSARTAHSTSGCRQTRNQDAGARNSHARKSPSSFAEKQDPASLANLSGASDTGSPFRAQACEPPTQAWCFPTLFPPSSANAFLEKRYPSVLRPCQTWLYPLKGRTSRELIRTSTRQKLIHFTLGFGIDRRPHYTLTRRSF